VRMTASGARREMSQGPEMDWGDHAAPLAGEEPGLRAEREPLAPPAGSDG